MSLIIIVTATPVATVITISQHHDKILRLDDDGIFFRYQIACRGIANCRFQLCVISSQ